MGSFYCRPWSVRPIIIPGISINPFILFIYYYWRIQAGVAAICIGSCDHTGLNKSFLFEWDVWLCLFVHSYLGCGVDEPYSYAIGRR